MENKKKVALSETDFAYQILREKKAPMHYRELITAVLERMGQDTAISGSRLAQIHTEINLDSRFDFLGKGMWGLLLWSSKPAEDEAAVGPNESRYQPKAADYLWDEEEDDDLDDDEEGCLIPDDEDIDDVDSDDEDDEEEDLMLDDLLDDEVEEDLEGLEDLEDMDDEPENS